MQEKARLEALLPEDWKKGFTTLLTLDGKTSMFLVILCTVCSVDSVQTRTMGHTTRSDPDGVERVVDFNLHGWRQSTKNDFFDYLKKLQIVQTLNEDSLSGTVSDALEMEKSNAVDLAEAMTVRHCPQWVPVWTRAPDVKTPDAEAENNVSDATVADVPPVVHSNISGAA